MPKEKQILSPAEKLQIHSELNPFSELPGKPEFSEPQEVASEPQGDRAALHDQTTQNLTESVAMLAEAVSASSLHQQKGSASAPLRVLLLAASDFALYAALTDGTVWFLPIRQREPQWEQLPSLPAS